MRVQMMVTISGGRSDGTPWPESGEFLETGDVEAVGLIRGRMAIPAPLPEPPFETGDVPALGTELRAAADEPAPVLAQAPEDPGEAGDAGEASQPPADTADGAAEGDPAPAADDATATGGPGVRAPKQDWVDHAVAAGCDPDAAASMTKADLITTFGSAP